MREGYCKFFSENKGFGFITDKDSGEDYFVYVSSLIDPIKKGDLVRFALGEGFNGKVAAFEVKKISLENKVNNKQD